MDYLFIINFFVCLPRSKIILMSQWQKKSVILMNLSNEFRSKDRKLQNFCGLSRR